MKLVLLALTGFGLAACEMLPPGLLPASMTAQTAAAPTPERRAEFIAVVEAAGCRLERVENEDVLRPAGFSDEEAGAIGGLLLSEGTARTAEDGDLILLTENCL